MDWPLFALITYGFLLVLIIVLIILRSRRAVRSQYARVLEEKETKLARMQIDLEESMEALDAYAEQLRLEWKKFQKDDQEGLSRLYKKEIDLEASFLALRARVTAIEVELKRERRAQPPQYQTAAEHAAAPHAAKEAMRQEAPALLHMPAPQALREPVVAAPLTPAYAPMEHANPHAMHFPVPSPESVMASAQVNELPQGADAAPAIECEAPAAQNTAPVAQAPAPAAQATAPISQATAPATQATAPTAQSEAPSVEGADDGGGDVQRRAQALYEAGEDAAAISQRLNISHTETSLLLKSLVLSRAREQTDRSRHEALEALDQGESPVEVARRFDLSHTEVALLAARKAHVASAGVFQNGSVQNPARGGI